MKNIIEREIERREALIEAKAAKEDEALALEVRAIALREEAAGIDTIMLESEIEELKEFLPAPEVLDEPIYSVECIDV